MFRLIKFKKLINKLINSINLRISVLYLDLLLKIKIFFGRLIKKIINKKKLKKKLKKKYFYLKDKFNKLYKRLYLFLYIKRYFYYKYEHSVLYRRVNLIVIVYFKLLSMVLQTCTNEYAKMVWLWLLECFWNELSFTSFDSSLWDYPHSYEVNVNLFISQHINPNVASSSKVTSKLPGGNWNKDLPGPEMKDFGRRPASIYSSGYFPTPGVENTRLDYEKYEYSLDRYKRKKLTYGPRFKYKWESPNGEKRWVYPEQYHTQKKTHSLFANTLRIYDEAGLTYSYHTESYYHDDRFCRVRYPDNTTVTIYDKKVVTEHIKYHRKHVAMNIRLKPAYFYKAEYINHFEPFRKAKVMAIFNDTPIVNRTSITIDELLNPVKDTNNLNTKKVAINDLLNNDNSNLNTEIINSNTETSNLNTETINSNTETSNSNIETSNSNTKKAVNKVKYDKHNFKEFVANSKKEIDVSWVKKTKSGWVDLKAIDWSDNSPKNEELKRLYYERFYGLG